MDATNDAPAPALLGVEIGGTKLQVGLGDAAARLTGIAQATVDPGRRHATAVRAAIAGLVAGVLEHHGVARSDVGAVGIGFGGPVDAENGRVIVSHQVPGWEDFDLAAWVRDDLGFRHVVVQNDSDTAALGEAVHGAGRGQSPILYVNSGSGVGGGLVIDGRIYRGGLGRGAVEIGHLRLYRPCGFSDLKGSWLEEQGAGRLDPRTDADEIASRYDDLQGSLLSVEQVASGWALARRGKMALTWCPEDSILARLALGEPDRVHGELVLQAADAGDPHMRRVVAEAVEALGEAIAHAVTLVAPRRVVLGGGVSLAPPHLWLDPLREVVARRVFAPFQGHYDIVSAALGSEVVVRGALELARQVAS